jgi:histone-lysine N-methyltransferase SETMAR
MHRQLLPAGQTVNASVCSEQLARVHEKMKTKGPALVTRNGKAKPEVAKVTREAIIRLGWETLVHPPHSPDVATSDCRLSHSLDNHLRGRQFRTLDDVKTALDGFFASRSKEFYHNAVQILDGDGGVLKCRV